MTEKTKEELFEEIEILMLQKIKTLANHPKDVDMLAQYVLAYKDFIRPAPFISYPYNPNPISPTVWESTK